MEMGKSVVPCVKSSLGPGTWMVKLRQLPASKTVWVPMSLMSEALSQRALVWGGQVGPASPGGGGRWKGCLRLQVKQTRKHIPAFGKEGTSSSSSKFVQFVVGGGI